MSAPTLYSGPAKVVSSISSTLYAFQAEGENGSVKLDLMEKRTRRSQASHGYIRSTVDDQMARIALTPFDSWALLPALFPSYIGVGTAASTASTLKIGTRPHDIAAGSANGNGFTKLWTPDGRLYNVVRTAITKHPGMHLGVGSPLYTGMEITGLIDAALAMGANGALISGNAITESGATDPDTTGFSVDFINGHWTGAWGGVTGFTTLDAEDGWDLTVDAKYSALTVQKRTYHYKLDSVECMIKARLTGPTHTQLAAECLARILGDTITHGSATDLVLTGPTSKTVTLKDCEVFMEGSGFEFGGTKLGTGDVAFISKIDFTSGAPGPALIFSA